MKVNSFVIMFTVFIFYSPYIIICAPPFEHFYTNHHKKISKNTLYFSFVYSLSYTIGFCNMISCLMDSSFSLLNLAANNFLYKTCLNKGLIVTLNLIICNWPSCVHNLFKSEFHAIFFNILFIWIVFSFNKKCFLLSLPSLIK